MLLRQSPIMQTEQRISLTEIAIFVPSLLLVVLAQMAAVKSFDVFHHPLWLDEYLTWSITNDPSFVHAMSAVRGGVDTNPPTLFLLLWPIAKVTGGLNEVGLRVFSLCSMLIAITGTYVMCRRFFPRLPSVI